jgi:hypothetical protein
MDGWQSIDMSGLLKAFQTFWVEKSEKYLKGPLYQEIAPLAKFISPRRGSSGSYVDMRLNFF